MALIVIKEWKERTIPFITIIPVEDVRAEKVALFHEESSRENSLLESVKIFEEGELVYYSSYMCGAN